MDIASYVLPVKEIYETEISLASAHDFWNRNKPSEQLASENALYTRQRISWQAGCGAKKKQLLE